MLRRVRLASETACEQNSLRPHLVVSCLALCCGEAACIVMGLDQHWVGLVCRVILLLGLHELPQDVGHLHVGEGSCPLEHCMEMYCISTPCASSACSFPAVAGQRQCPLILQNAAGALSTSASGMQHSSLGTHTLCQLSFSSILLLFRDCCAHALSLSLLAEGLPLFSFYFLDRTGCSSFQHNILGPRGSGIPTCLSRSML